MKVTEEKLRLARELLRTWEQNEKSMGEMAAYNVACEQLGIAPYEGWELLDMLPEKLDLASPGSGGGE